MKPLKNPIITLITTKALSFDEVRKIMDKLPSFMAAAIKSYSKNFSAEEKLDYITRASGGVLPLNESWHDATLIIAKVFVKTVPNAKELLEAKLNAIQSRSDLTSDFVLNPIRYMMAAYCMCKDASLEEKVVMLTRLEKIVGWDFSYNPNDNGGMKHKNILIEVVDIKTVSYKDIFYFNQSGVYLTKLLLKEKLGKENLKDTKFFSGLLRKYPNDATLIDFCVRNTGISKKRKIALIKDDPNQRNLLLSLYSKEEQLIYVKKDGNYDLLRSFVFRCANYDQVKHLYEHTTVKNHDFFTPFYEMIRRGLDKPSEFTGTLPSKKELLTMYREHPSDILAYCLLYFFQLTSVQLKHFYPLLLEDKATNGFLKQENFKVSNLSLSDTEKLLVMNDDSELIKSFFDSKYNKRYFNRKKLTALIEAKIARLKNRHSSSGACSALDMLISLSPIPFDKKYEYAQGIDRYGKGYTWLSLVKAVA